MIKTFRSSKVNHNQGGKSVFCAIKSFLALLIAFFCVLSCVAFCLFGCGNKKASGKKYTLYAPDGAPALSVSGVMDGELETVIVQPNTIASFVGNGTADFAILPVSAAATLYNKGVKIKLLSVNTHGNLYFVGKENIALDGLKGKKIGVIGRGQVPDLTLRILLNKAEVVFETDDADGLGAAHLLYYDDGAALIPSLKKGNVDVALLGEPAASGAVNKLGAPYIIAADLQSLWRTAFCFDYPQAALVVKSSIIESDKSKVDEILSDIKAGDDYAKNNVASALDLIKTHMAAGLETTLPGDITKEIIDRCNIKTVSASECKDDLNDYFKLLTELKIELEKPALSKIPSDEFYYT